MIDPPYRVYAAPDALINARTPSSSYTSTPRSPKTNAIL
jgi:hypothetical protein